MLPGAVLISVLSALSHLIFTVTPGSKCLYSQFTDEETEAQKGLEACLSSHG